MAIFKRKYTNKAGKNVEIQKWSVDFRDHDGIVRRVAAFTDRSASLELERHLKKLVSFRMAGVGPDAESSRFLESCPVEIRDHLAEWGIIAPERAAMGKALTGHIEAWGRHLEARQCSPSHCTQAVARVKKIFEGCRIVYWTDLRAEKVESWLGDFRRDGVGNRTSNSYLSSAKAFCEWMKKAGYATDNPLSRLGNLNEGIDIRHVRRALESEEIDLLIGVVQSSKKTYWCMNGYDREMLYRTALETGLRWGELRSLTRSSFDLSGNPPTVTVSAGAAKNRRTDTMPLQAELAAMLAKYFKHNPGLPLSPAFTMPKGNRGSKIIAHDLEEAGIAKVDACKRIVDFHSLRHTFITNLARAGVHPKIAQDLARHSTIELTMRNYTHTRLESRVEALGKLPTITATSPKSADVAKTGTDDILVDDDSKIVVMRIDSNGTDFMDNIKTYRDKNLFGNVLHGKGVKTNNPLPGKGLKDGAGEGNRTLMTSLEGWSSAIELRPHES